MTYETLDRCNELKDKISKTEKIIHALEAPYVNTIRAVDYWGDKECTQVIDIERDRALYKYILQYYKDKLTSYKSEFDVC